MAVKKYRAKKIILKLLFGILVLVIIIPVLFSLYFMLISSLKSMTQVYIMPPKLFGFKPILNDYIYIFRTQHYGAYMMNSTIVTVTSTALSLLLGVPAVYAIARYRVRKVNTTIPTVRLLPNISILLLYYFILSELHMIGTCGVLILSRVMLSLPLIAWIIMGFFSDLPLELEETAIVGGCTRQEYLRDVLLPASVPGLVTCFTLPFLGSWNNFRFALILSGEETRTLPVSPQYFASGASIYWGHTLATTIVVVVPTIILTILLQKCIVQDMTAGTVKGQDRINDRNRPEAVTEEINVVISMLIHGKGIYNSDAMKMKYTGVALGGSRIKEMDRSEELNQVYPDIRVIDFSDSYILPGLVNTHAHLEFVSYRDTYDIYRRENREARLAGAAGYAKTLLRSGMTTVRDAGSSMDLVGAPSGREAGSEPGTELPRVQATGMPLTPNGGHLVFLEKTSNSTEELIQTVRERRSADCDCIKLIVSGSQLTPGSIPEHGTYNRGEIWAAMEAAHELGLSMAAHCLTTSSCVNATGAGVDSMEHCAYFRRNRRLGFLGRCYEPDAMEAFREDHRYFMIGVSDNYHQLDQVREGVRKPDEREAFLLEQEKRECEIFGRLADLGMCPLVEADAGCGYTFFDGTWLEMELSCRRRGLTSERAIHAATLKGARTLGYGDFLGRLAPGYEADFIATA